MTHDIHKILSFRFVAPHTLEITFENELSRTINFLPVLHGEIYSPLRNPEYFKKVTLDPEVQTLVWPNGADFEPTLLFEWDQHLEELMNRAKRW